MTFSSKSVPPKSSAPNWSAIWPVLRPSENHDAWMCGTLSRKIRESAMRANVAVGSGFHSHLPGECGVVPLVGPRNERGELARFPHGPVLDIANVHEAFDDVFVILDVAIHHRRSRHKPDAVRLYVDLRPLIDGVLGLESAYLGFDPVREYFRAPRRASSAVLRPTAPASLPVSIYRRPRTFS